MSRSRPRLVVVGDALLDVDVEGAAERLAPDAPVPVVDVRTELDRPGGAGLAAVLAVRAGAACTLVTALGDDDAGRRVAARLAAEGVDVVDLGRLGPTPSTTRVRVGGQVLVRIDHDDDPTRLGPGEPSIRAADLGGAQSAVDEADAVLVADHGRGVAGVAHVRRLLLAAAARTPIVWDPHPLGPPPVPRVALLTPNDAELRRLVAIFVPPAGGEAPAVGAVRSIVGVTGRARLLREHWRAVAVAVTRGADGAVLVTGPGAPLVVPAPEVVGADTGGAGDAFAVHAALALAGGAVHSEAVVAAVDGAAAFVAAGAAGSVRPPAADAPGRAPADVGRHDADAWDAADSRAPEPPSKAMGAAGPSGASSGSNGPATAGAGDALRLVRSVRAAGGTVVATGGCFDLLHVGHIRLLEQARRLGDVLVVCLNGDRSVRGLKGGERPVVDERERAEVLAALGCVDAVVVLDEPTPTALLERLRPHLFVKGGGDDGGAELPEAAAVRRWGGEVVTLTCVDDRSSTRLLQEARRVP